MMREQSGLLRSGLLERLAIVGAILVCCMGCDQATKSIAQSMLPEAETWSYLGDSIRLQLAHNEGAFLSLGSELPELWRGVIFLGLVGAVLLGVLAHALLGSHSSPWSVVGLALAFAGGISNLVDRIFNEGRVVDFMNVGIGPLRTGIFNVADVAILGGVVLLLIREARSHPSSPPPAES
jgi:signal peptidase II